VPDAALSALLVFIHLELTVHPVGNISVYDNNEAPGGLAQGHTASKWQMMLN
jgi:hypothetical protein